ncbi:MAG: RagB/SusD family nutrient uptake outer membrane protein [Bacteroidaceae bacterium]|nr:RagB/SusD family nutrient uptake outer membrane protein [Bacteroidaceae bacterium]
MKKIIYKTIIALALPLWGLGGFTSCSEMDSDLVSFVEDNQLDTPNDTVYSLMGIVNKMQVIADRTVLLGELRGDLTSLTANAKLDLQDIANFTAGTDNPYNNARDYYAVIQNCNYFLHYADTMLTKRGVKVFEKEYAVVKAYRAWTYLQLAINYGSVPFFTEPLLTEKDAQPTKYEYYDVTQIANYFIKDLAPYVDTEYPDYGSIGTINSRRFYIPVRVLLGDLCLWAGRYQESAQYYHDYLTKQGDVHPTGIGRVAWKDYEFQEIEDGYASQFLTQSTEILTIIPMEEEEYNGVVSYLRDVFNSTEDNNYFYQATHSPAYDELSRSQRFVLVYTDPVTQLPDTVSPLMVYPSESLKGDLRQQSIFTLRNEETKSNTLSSIRQTCYKYTSGHVNLYRLQHVYLRFAEALNRAGYPESAFAVLKHGLCKDFIDRYIPEKERKSAGSLLSFSEYTFPRENTQGTHSRGSGNANADTTYVIPALSTAADTIQYVEDKICDEMALETAAEGLRFYDLMRISLHRNDPTFLADKVARRKGSSNYDSALYSLLSDQKNWYLKLE